MIKRRWLWIVLAFIVIILLTGVAFFLLGSPRVQEVSPSAGEIDVPAGAGLRLSFSRKMDVASVEERLEISPPHSGDFTWQDNTLVFSPSPSWSPGVTITVSLKKGAQAAGWLALPTRDDQSWSFSVRQPSLIYLYPSDAAANLYIYDLHSGESTQISNVLGGILEFDVNAAGTAVFYSAENGLGGSDIYKMVLGDPLESSTFSTVLHCKQMQCRAPRISPQDSYLAFEKTAPPGSNEPGYPQVWYVSLLDQDDGNLSAAGKELSDAIKAGEKLNQTVQPQWSSTGNLTFYDSTQQAFITIEIPDGKSDAFQNQTGEPGTWDPTGRYYVAPEIIFNQETNPDNTSELQSIASSHLIRFEWQEDLFIDLTGVDNLEDTSPAYSPDGTALAFARKYLDVTRWTPGRQIWLMNADGSGARPLTQDPYFNHFNLVWDPEGNQIAYVRFDETEQIAQPEIWLLDLKSGFYRQLIVGGFSPRWVP